MNLVLAPAPALEDCESTSIITCSTSPCQWHHPLCSTTTAAVGTCRSPTPDAPQPHTDVCHTHDKPHLLTHTGHPGPPRALCPGSSCAPCHVPMPRPYFPPVPITPCPCSAGNLNKDSQTLTMRSTQLFSNCLLPAYMPCHPRPPCSRTCPTICLAPPPHVSPSHHASRRPGDTDRPLASLLLHQQGHPGDAAPPSERGHHCHSSESHALPTVPLLQPPTPLTTPLCRFPAVALPQPGAARQCHTSDMPRQPPPRHPTTMIPSHPC